MANSSEKVPGAENQQESLSFEEVMDKTGKIKTDLDDMHAIMLNSSVEADRRLVGSQDFAELEELIGKARKIIEKYSDGTPD